MNECYFCGNQLDTQQPRQKLMMDGVGKLWPVSICSQCDGDFGTTLSDVPDSQELAEAMERHPAGKGRSKPSLTVIPGEGKGTGNPKGKLHLVKGWKAVALTDIEKPKAVGIDLDGTLASAEWRREYVDKFCPNCQGSRPFGKGTLNPNCQACGGTGKKPNFKPDFDTFHSNLRFDAPVPAVVNRIHQLRNQGVAIVLHTGRMEAQRSDTVDWLTQHNIPWDHLYMRPDGDTRKDSIVKGEMYDNLITPQYHVIETHDDRPQVLKMWFKKRRMEGRDDSTKSNFWNIVVHEDPNIAPHLQEQGR